MRGGGRLADVLCTAYIYLEGQCIAGHSGVDVDADRWSWFTACWFPGTRGSHAMVIVLDEAGMVALKPPVVVQECRNHGAKLFKVQQQ